MSKFWRAIAPARRSSKAKLSISLLGLSLFSWWQSYYYQNRLLPHWGPTVQTISGHRSNFWELLCFFFISTGIVSGNLRSASFLRSPKGWESEVTPTRASDESLLRDVNSEAGKKRKANWWREAFLIFSYNVKEKEVYWEGVINRLNAVWWGETEIKELRLRRVNSY